MKMTLGKIVRPAASLALVALLVAPARGDRGGVPGDATVGGAPLRFTSGRPAPGAPARAYLLAGVLSGPSRRAPVEVARAYLATRPEPLLGVEPGALAPARTARLPGGGAVVSFDQTFGGLPVVGGRVSVRLDGEGRVRWIKSSASTIPAGLDTVPAIPAAEATRLVAQGAARHQGLAGLDPRQARLVVLAPPGQVPRLAWQVMVPRNLLHRQTLRVYLDAGTGALVSVENRVMTTHRATVFPENPVATPTTTEVTLALPTDPAPATILTGADIAAASCIDRHNCTMIATPFGDQNVHMCDVEPAALADETDGDFLHYARPASDTDPEDPFSEVQMYHHATRAYAAFRALGFGDLNARPLSAVVNYRIPDIMNDPFSALCVGTTNPNELVPFDNAAFMPAGSLFGYPPEDSIIFGQGTAGDFAYDGDVVYHEFTHAVMGTVTPLGFVKTDVFGLDTTTGGMHEGYADYFSCAITGDPETGEYAGASLTGGAIRSLENDAVCPGDLVGETHDDGEIWGGALWDVRQALVDGGFAAAAVDEALYAAMEALGEFDNFETAAAATVAELTVLGGDAATRATAAFAARGVDGCDDRIIAVEAGYTKPSLFLYGTDQIAVGTVPGPVQWRLELPAGAESITVDVGDTSPMGMSMTPSAGSAKLLAKADEPIHWAWGAQATHDATAECTATLPAPGGPASCTIAGPFPAGTVYLQLASTGVTFFLANVELTAAPLAEPDAGVPDAAPSSPDAGGAGDDGDGDCGCRVGAAPGGPAPLSLLALALLLGDRIRGRKRRN